MKKILLSILFSVGSLIVGIILACITFASSWGLAEGSMFRFLFLILIILFVSFAIPYIFSLFISQYWFIYSVLISMPLVILYTSPIIDNLELGNFAIALILPLIIVIISSFAGSILGKKRGHNELSRV